MATHNVWICTLPSAKPGGGIRATAGLRVEYVKILATDCDWRPS